MQRIKLNMHEMVLLQKVPNKKAPRANAPVIQNINCSVLYQLK